MSDDTAAELQALQKQLVKTVMLGMPGTLLVALALFTEMSNDAPIHPLLNNQNVVIGMFIVGGAIMFWSMLKRIGIMKRQQALRKANNG